MKEIRGGGVIWGLYFGNPLLGCANGAAGSLITQNLKSLKFPKKGNYEQMNNKLKDILLNSLSFFPFQVVVLLAFKWNNKQNVNIDYSTLASLAIGGIVFGILMNLFLVKEILEKNNSSYKSCHSEIPLAS